jgi:hypothetical protein
MDIQIILKELNYNYIHKSLQNFHRQQKKKIEIHMMPCKVSICSKKDKLLSETF